MKIEEIDSAEYAKLFDNPFIPYNSVAFNKLNNYKCDKLEFLLFHEDNKKLGLIAGIKANGLFSPFSAPFSSFSVQDNNIKLNYIINANLLLEDYARSQNLDSLKFVLPPCFYNEHFISKLIFCFNKNNYTTFVEVNHYFRLKDYARYYEGNFDKGIRYNLKYAIKKDLALIKANNIDEYRLAFDVILINKKSKNYSQSVSFDQLLEVKKLIEVDFFIVYYKNEPIASSIIYNYPPNIAQLIFWGDIPSFSKYYPMNFQAWNIFRFYREKSFDIVDLGTSMVDHELNVGLCNFKEVIGCTVSAKFTFHKDLMTNHINPE